MARPGSEPFDLVIRNGSVVTDSGTLQVDVGIRRGRIDAISSALPSGTNDIDAVGKLVLPGGIDAHTHFANEVGGSRTADDFESGTISAAFGGITTIINYAIQSPRQPLAEAIGLDLSRAQESSVIDFSSHLIVTDPSIAGFDSQMAELVGLGCPSVKVFTAVDDFRLPDRDLLRVLRAARRHGIMVNVHAEDGAMIDDLTDELLAAGHVGIRWLPRSRPPLVEATAIRRVASYAQQVGTPVYFVHVSSAAGLRAIRDARSEGATVYAETRPAYLFLDESCYDGDERQARYVACWPPIRAISDQAALWDGIADATIDTYATDHTSWMAAEKLRPDLNFGEVPGGFANVETSIGMLFGEGVATGRISLARFVDVTATRPAKIFGLWPRKGSIAVGSDADIVIIDPAAEITITEEMSHSRSDVLAYRGRRTTGWPVTTISRGEVVVDHGMLLGAKGRGRPAERKQMPGPGCASQG